MTDQRGDRAPITLNIAGFGIQLTTEDRTASERIRARYKDFIGHARSPELKLDLQVTPGVRYIDPAPGPWIINVNYKDDRLFFESYLERGTVDLAAGTGVLEMAPEANIENFLRTAVAWLCITNNAVLLHAAGVVRHGLGYVFFGPSGSGKTTTSRISAKAADVVSDDLVVVRIMDGTARLYGVPFRGEMAEATRANQNAPLKAIFRLRQDINHYLEPLSNAKATADLVASSPFVVQEQALTSALVDICSKISRSVPVMDLHFKRDDGFWKVIDEYFQNVS